MEAKLQGGNGRPSEEPSSSGAIPLDEGLLEEAGLSGGYWGGDAIPWYSGHPQLMICPTCGARAQVRSESEWFHFRASHFGACTGARKN